jgi:hypothetical protein
MPPPKPARKAARTRSAASEKVAALASPPTGWPPVGPNWRHEVKRDGHRLCVVIDGGRSTVRTRRGHDWTHRFRSIAAAAAALPRPRGAFSHGRSYTVFRRTWQTIAQRPARPRWSIGPALRATLRARTQGRARWAPCVPTAAWDGQVPRATAEIRPPYRPNSPGRSSRPCGRISSTAPAGAKDRSRRPGLH